MQNLITKLMQPILGEDKPSTLKRRAGEALATALNQQQADLQGRLVAEKDAERNLAQLDEHRRLYGPNNCADFYQDAMNQDYRDNMQ